MKCFLPSITNAYEIVGVLFGALAWIAILGIIGIFIAVHVIRILKSKYSILILALIYLKIFSMLQYILKNHCFIISKKGHN